MKPKDMFDLLDKLSSETAIKKGPDSNIYFSEKVNAVLTSEITGAKKHVGTDTR